MGARIRATQKAAVVVKADLNVRRLISRFRAQTDRETISRCAILTFEGHLVLLNRTETITNNQHVLTNLSPSWITLTIVYHELD